MGKMGSICHFPRPLPASQWGHCSQILVFTTIWGTQKGVWQWHFSCCFSQHLRILGPPKLQNKGKRKMTDRPCFALPQETPPTQNSFRPSLPPGYVLPPPPPKPFLSAVPFEIPSISLRGNSCWKVPKKWFPRVADAPAACSIRKAQHPKFVQDLCFSGSNSGRLFPKSKRSFPKSKRSFPKSEC